MLWVSAELLGPLFSFHYVLCPFSFFLPSFYLPFAFSLLRALLLTEVDCEAGERNERWRKRRLKSDAREGRELTQEDVGHRKEAKV